MLFAPTVFLAFLAATPESASALAIEKDVRQLFFDDYLIDSTENLTRTLHQPEKHPQNPVLKREHPWEGFRVQVYGTMLYDPAEAIFKAWYMNIPATAAEKISVNGQRRPGHATLLSYATSADGINWRKPVLNLVDFEGSTANNMIAPALYNPEGFSVLHEPEDPDPARRYKAFYWDHGRGPLMMWEGQEIYGEGPDDGMHVAFSPDGIQWTPYAGNPVMKVGSDSGQCVLYDPRLKQYVAFSRLGFGRKVARSISPDFIHWSAPELVLAPDATDGPKTEFYGISVDLYEGLYIGVLWMFWIDAGVEGRIDFQLCHSRDGITWVRDPERRVFLGNGPEEAWDGGDMRAACRSVILPDRILFYYAGSQAKHGLGGKLRIGMDIGLATLRRDGWVSLDAAEETATLLSKPFVHPGGNLHLNLQTEGDGFIRPELLDQNGEPMNDIAPPGPVKGDSCDLTVPLASSRPENLAGKVVRLKLTLQHARLFSLWFDPGSP